MYEILFSKRLREAMEIEGVSKRALSSRTGIDRRGINLWLNGKYLPRYDALIKLSMHFKLRINYLLGLDDYLAEEGDFLKIKRCDINEVPIVFLEKFKLFVMKHTYTKYALAKKLEINQKLLTQWMMRGSMPETANLVKIANLLSISLDELLGQE